MLRCMSTKRPFSLVNLPIFHEDHAKRAIELVANYPGPSKWKKYDIPGWRRETDARSLLRPGYKWVLSWD